MNEAYERIMEAAEDGGRVSINFINRTCKVNGRLVDISSIEMPEWSIEELERRYSAYEVSRPSERTEKRRRLSFKAKTLEQLTQLELCFGKPRELARVELELYLLFHLTNGLQWDDSWGSWFWKSANYRNLILLKEWFNGRQI